MKKLVIAFTLLFGLLLTGCGTLVTTNSKPTPASMLYQSKNIERAVTNWANAYCNLDGNTLLQLFDPGNKDAFYQLKNVNSTKNDIQISFGNPNLWPDQYQYEYLINDHEAVIYYYIMTPDYHTSVWKETLTIGEQNGLYYVLSEQMNEYSFATTNDELLACFIDENRSTLSDYKYNLLHYQMKKFASITKDKLPIDLFSPETAAPYLLNLSGGNCTVLANYDSYAFVSYHFGDGKSVNLSLIKPFGNAGIWLVDAVGTSGDFISTYSTYESWHQQLQLKDLTKFNTIATPEEISDPDNVNAIKLIAALPEDDVWLYYGNDTTILRIKDYFQCFPLWGGFLSEENTFPELAYSDYDNDGQKEVAIYLHNSSENGPIRTLRLVKQNADGTMQSMVFSPYQYIAQLKRRVSADYNEETGILQFNIDGNLAGNINISDKVNTESNYIKIDFGDFPSYNLTNNTITFSITPTLYLSDGIPEFNKMPTLTAKIELRDNQFFLSNLEYKNSTQ